ncbi:unnamed protein product [Caenorhabditis angaria]|uniref:Uncharacterized protein n=1 Tax=Caenorhabditis angaria TaxID=860376 RepID=A0A9P1IHD2_9PELO|nr:unnamed protein product [Caenorhabditis angaria]
MRFYWVVLLVVTVVLISLAEAKKQKSAAKTIPASSVPQPSSPKQQTQYDQCKIQCKTQREFIGKQELVEQLRRELELAENLLETRKANLPDEFQNSTETSTTSSPENARKISRYDHLKAAASKIVESGSELKQAVTGDNSN